MAPDNGNWKIKQLGTQRTSGNFNTQAKAIARARKLATKQHKELYIHGRNWQIRLNDSHSNDPRDIKDLSNLFKWH